MSKTNFKITERFSETTLQKLSNFCDFFGGYGLRKIFDWEWFPVSRNISLFSLVFAEDNKLSFRETEAELSNLFPNLSEIDLDLYIPNLSEIDFVELKNTLQACHSLDMLDMSELGYITLGVAESFLQRDLEEDEEKLILFLRAYGIVSSKYEGYSIPSAEEIFQEFNRLLENFGLDSI